MKKLILVLLLAFLVPVAYATKVKSIYEAEVPVVSQSDAVRAQAIQQAFVQTLNKISGSANIQQNPVIKAALPDATNRVDQYEYNPSGIAATPYFLKVQFDPKAMKKLLREAKAPIWEENRPLVLVWLAVETPGHPGEVIDSNSTNEFAVLMKKEALQRGLPILLPMMDLTEINKVSVDMIRSKNVDALDQISDRYHSDAMLIGNIEPKDKSLVGHWKLVLDDDQWSWDLTSDTAQGLIAQLNDKLVSTLAGRYAAVQTEEVSSSFTLVIKGVSQQDDIDNLLRFIKHISLIKQLEIESINGDQVVLHVDVQGSQKAFMQDASVGQHLKLELQNDDELTYSWLR